MQLGKLLRPGSFRGGVAENLLLKQQLRRQLRRVHLEFLPPGRPPFTPVSAIISARKLLRKFYKGATKLLSIKGG